MAPRDRNNDGDIDGADRIHGAIQDLKGIGSSIVGIKQTVTSLERDPLKAIGIVRSTLGLSKVETVPTDEIHVVIGEGSTIWTRNNEAVVYGRSSRKSSGNSADKGTSIDSADTTKSISRGSMYRRNRLTSVTRVVTTSFEVPVPDIEVFDNQNIRFVIDAFCQAALDPEKALDAAEKVGGSVGALATSLVQIVRSAVIQASAKMSLDEILANRSVLEDKANDAVEKHLQNLGYKLIVMTIADVYGEAVKLKGDQALAEISRDTAIKTNLAQLAKDADEAKKQIRSAEIAAERDRETAEKARESELAIAEGAHTTELRKLTLQQGVAEATNQTRLKEVDLLREVQLADTTAKAEVAKKNAENQAVIRSFEVQKADELAAEQQVRQAQLQLSQTQAAAQVADIEQARLLDRKKSQQEADLEREKATMTGKAETEKTVLLIKADAEAQAKKTGAEADARAAVLTAEGATSQATAKIALANATRAEESAKGLAQAEVDERMAQVAIVQANAEKAKGLAQAEVDRAQQQVAVDIEKLRADLYMQHPVLLELEKARMQIEADYKKAQLEQQSHVQMIQALAPQMNVRVFGNGGQMSALLGQLMTINATATVAGEEVPAIGNLLGMNGSPSILSSLPSIFGGALSAIDPSLFTNMSLKDVLAEVAKMNSGDQTLTGAISELRKSNKFEVIANLPVIELAQAIMAKSATSNGATDVAPVS